MGVSACRSRQPSRSAFHPFCSYEERRFVAVATCIWSGMFVLLPSRDYRRVDWLSCHGISLVSKLDHVFTSFLHIPSFSARRIGVSLQMSPFSCCLICLPCDPLPPRSMDSQTSISLKLYLLLRDLTIDFLSGHPSCKNTSRGPSNSV